MAHVDPEHVEGVDVVVTDSVAGLQPLGDKVGERVSLRCSDEVVLVGPAGMDPLPVKEAIAAAQTILVADPRGAGAGEAGEAALGRLGLRATIARKLRYVATAREVMAGLTPGTVGLVMLSDLGADKAPSVSLLSDRFDGARGCPTAAVLARAAHPVRARALLARLARRKD